MRFLAGLLVGFVLWLPGLLALRWFDSRCPWQYGIAVSPSGQPFTEGVAQKFSNEGTEIVLALDQQRWLIRRRAC